MYFYYICKNMILLQDLFHVETDVRFYFNMKFLYFLKSFLLNKFCFLEIFIFLQFLKVDCIKLIATFFLISFQSFPIKYWITLSTWLSYFE